MRFNPYPYQQQAMQWIKDHKRCGLFLDMGLGKTVSTLTAIQDLMDEADVISTLVVAPKKVAEATWTSEASKWDHLDIVVSKVLGTEKQRIEALERKADVYVTGRDNFVWLVEHYHGSLPFDCLVIDELTSFKSNTSQRFKAMRAVSPTFHRVIGLTGTPAPNGLIDLWAQMYCLDLGERLGKSLTRYRESYFSIRRWNNIIVKCTVRQGCEDIIRGKIADICLSMQAKDYLSLPEMIVHDVPVDLGGKLLQQYKDFEQEQVLSFQEAHKDEPSNIIANSAAGLMSKLQQFANGAVYDDEKEAHEIHDCKLEYLREIVEAAQSPVLVFYQFIADIPRITKALKGFTVRKYESDKDLTAWNAGEIDVLLAHPASTAYGLNMQDGGHYIVWYGLTWNLELYQQANARLHRQGQKCPVQVYRLLASDTVDYKVKTALQSKKGVQQSLLDALKEMLLFYEKEGQSVNV